MIGQTLNNFEIVRLLGSGGMGSVYEGLDLELRRRVAIKVLNPELSRDALFAERFHKEAMALARLNHPNVTGVYSFFRHGEQLFLVMELVDGERLDHLVRSRGGLPWPEAVEIACQILAGLEHAHAHEIVHRDVKPSNCLLTPQGRVKITDFGIAFVAGYTRLTQSGNIVGTAEYIAPELIMGRVPDARADLYSLGAVLYEMATGRVPFLATTVPDLVRAHLEIPPLPPRTLVPQLPDWLERTILHALAKDPRYRFQTAGEMTAALRQGLASHPTVEPDRQSPPPLPPPPPATTRGGGSRLLLGATLFLLVAAAVIIGLVVRAGREEAAPTTPPAISQEPEPEPSPPPPATTLPEPAPEPPPPPVAVAAVPPARDETLRPLCQLAGRLQLAGKRLRENYRAGLREAGRWPAQGADEVLLDQVGAFAVAAERLQAACASTDQRQALWSRAAELVALGNQLAVSLPESEVSISTQATWLTIKDRLAELERAIAGRRG